MRRLGLIALGLLVATAAQAETLRVEVWYPAASESAAALQSIQIEPFGGDAGADLTIQVEDSLREARSSKGPYYQIIPAATGSGGEALLRGTADTEQRFTDYTEERERCIKDDKGNCTSAREKIVVKCRRRHIELVVQLRLIARDGTLLWSDNRPESFEDSRCEDSETSPRARSSIARELAGRVATRVRRDFVPRSSVELLRVDEGRKGLSKGDSAAFKEAVRQTKKDAEISCNIWAGLAARNPDHAPTQFNLGLCAEASFGQASASEQYRKVLAINPKHRDARAGLDRLSAKERTRRQLDAHDAD